MPDTLPSRYMLDFPKLSPENHKKTSEKTRRYNCIAHAAGDDRKWWWPLPDPFGFRPFWPAGSPEELTLEAFRAAFTTIQYKECANGVYEEGFEKIAIYALNNQPTHAARQIDASMWSSKLGGLEDIAHHLEDLSGPHYGEVVLYMRRAMPPKATDL